jgi:cytochrome c-type biogenesis protein CcmF
MGAFGSISSFGTVVLALGLVVTFYSGVAAALGARRPSLRLQRSAEHALYGVFALLLVASALLIYAFVSHDYSIKYVHRYSDATMPLWYLVTSYWGGLDGSLLFWAFLLSASGALAVWLNRDRHREMLPWIIVVLQAVQAFFLLLLVFERNPFAQYIPGAMLPTDGRGLNPLLQNPYMVTHPPALYLGYVGMTVPFAFGLAALISGRLDESWLLSIRRWVILSWFCLTVGLVLGMIWAYEELGWGGYWAWDPVENAGLIPWLTATALLHSIMIQERRSMFKVWNVVLVAVTFLLTIVGTFMTRSGVVQSVHAFGQDTRLAIIFAIFMLLIIAASVFLILWRLPLLRSRHEIDSLLSREFFFLLNNWILLFAAAFVLVATLWPTISEAVFGQRATMGALFFNTWMTPLGLILLLLTGIGPIIPWRHASTDSLLRQFMWPVVGAIVVLVGVIVWDYAYTRWAGDPAAANLGEFLRDRISSVGVAPLFCFALSGFVMATILQEFWRGSRVRARSLGIDRFTALIGLVVRGRRRYGGYLVHAGIVLMFIGFAGGAFHRDLEASMRKGQTVDFAGYRFKLEDVVRASDPQKEMVSAAITVFRDGKPVRRMAPGKWTYNKHEDQPTTEVDIWRQAGRDVYLILVGYDLKEGQASLKLVINPLINWLWLGFLLLALGTSIALAPENVLRRVRATDLDTPEPPARARPTGAAAAGLLLVVLAGSLAFAQGAMPPPAPMAPLEHSAKAVITNRSPVEQRLFRRIVCMCNTCPRLPLSECGCGYADKERTRITRMLQEGKSEAQVLDAFLAQYGQAALGAPIAGASRYAWMILYGLGAGAIVLVVVMAVRWTRRRPGAGATAAPADGAAPPADGAAASPTDKKYEEKLDAELDELD